MKDCQQCGNDRGRTAALCPAPMLIECGYCGEPVFQDENGSWVDCTGGDGCESGEHLGRETE